MLSFEGRKGVEFCDGLTRRNFLRAGALSAGAVGLSLADLSAMPSDNSQGSINCILLFLVGGPSHLDTWDLKPDAPSHIRGPFRPIRTNVPGIELGECFPRMASMADRFALVRSVHHDAAPVHETGHQLMQTGRLSNDGREYPHFGAVVSHLRGPRESGMPANVILPARIGNTGVSVSHGQSAGLLGAEHEAFVLASDDVNLDPARLTNRKALLNAVDAAQRAYDARTATNGDHTAMSSLFDSRSKAAFDIFAESRETRRNYGGNTFGQSCLLARRLVEHGVRFVTVNMFDSVFNKVTWDCHADGGALATGLDDYRDILCPMFDRAYTALLEDLRQRGMLANTMVVAMGEFGRTPIINPRGGRDHWPSAWTVLFAGGNVRGGQVIGSTDKHGEEPKDCPVHASSVAASIYHGLGINGKRPLAMAKGTSIPVAESEPVRELFA